MKVAFMLAVVYLAMLNTVTLGNSARCSRCNEDFKGFGSTPHCKCGCCPWPCHCDCIEGHVCPTLGPPECPCIDIAFIVDESGSIGPVYWGIITNFMVDLVNDLEKANGNCSNEVAVAPITFGTNATLHWNIHDQQNNDLASIIAALNNIVQKPGQTNIVEGMEVAINEVFPNGRPGCANFAVIITDGRASMRLGELPSMASNLIAATDDIICVGLTKNADYTQLSIICTPDNIIDDLYYEVMLDAGLDLLNPTYPTLPPCEEREEKCYCCCTPEQYWGLRTY